MGTPEAVDDRGRLSADCANCFGLCCVAPEFTRSADFAIDKPAGTPCPNLQPGFGCGIHTELRERGYPGCTVYDCFGAGQQIAQVTFGGLDWRREPATAGPMFAAFAVMRHLHELLYYLTESVQMPTSAPILPDLRDWIDRVERLTYSDPATLRATDAASLRAQINPLLVTASELARAQVKGPKHDHRGADLIGADLRKADLRGSSLRGALLIGADLRKADLRGADVIGADFRAADVRRADLTGTLYLTQAQLDAARGDGTTVLPSRMQRPGHWKS